MQHPIRMVTSRSLSVHPAATKATTLQEIAANRKGLAKVVLKKGKTHLFCDGNPMVFSGAVDRIIGRPPPKTGDIVLVADQSQNPIGWGMFNSVSMYRVRLMQLEEEATRDPSCALDMDRLLEMRVNAATSLRQKLGLPSEDTNAYRLINSEGDRLSGLIVDVFDDVAVIASSAAWVEKYRAQIELYLSNLPNIERLIWRPSVGILKEDGLDFTEQQQSDDLSKAQGKVKMLKKVTNFSCQIMENGIYYLVSTDGQKTGFYADQRDNRQYIKLISNGQKVLDVFCYSGGFALNAAKGGAVDVVGVDSSLPAIELAKENVLLNNLDPAKVSLVREDASEFMKDAASRQESWDVIILDPPKLAPKRKDLRSASRMYRNLNSLAMKLIRSGGLLMTCSCSGAITQNRNFLHILQGAASSAGRKITVLRQSGAACDHPLDPSYPEGAYLTNILLRVL